MKLDFVIKNIFICNGVSGDLVKADLGVHRSKIVMIAADIPPGDAASVFHGGGKLLCPGFIDVHSHSDISIFACPETTGKISQGVTSEIVGNCGLSAFPISSKNRSHLNKLYRNYGVKIDWDTHKSYSNRLSEVKPAGNIFSLCGYNTLRAAVAGYKREKLSRSDIYKMIGMLEMEMKGGGVGLSTGFLYVPGIFADKSELETIFSIFSSHRKPWATHLRSESKFLLESLEETFELALKSGIRKVHISHLKTAGRENWNKIDEVFRLVSRYSELGLNITADRYPYTESMTQLSSFLPEPFDQIDDVSLMKMMKKPAKEVEFMSRLAEKGDEIWLDRRIVSTAHCEFRRFSGDTFQKVSREVGRRPIEIVAELIKNDAPGTMVSSPGMNEDNMRRICCSDFICCGTDESARPFDYSIGRSHPRGFGSMPEFFKIVSRKLGICEAVRKMTSMPAKIFGLSKRGIIKEGYYADMVLIDPDKFSSTANFANPHSPAEGVIKVWVNGKESYPLIS